MEKQKTTLADAAAAITEMVTAHHENAKRIGDAAERWIYDPADRYAIASHLLASTDGFASDTDVTVEAYGIVARRMSRFGLRCNDAHAAALAMAIEWRRSA